MCICKTPRHVTCRGSGSSNAQMLCNYMSIYLGVIRQIVPQTGWPWNSQVMGLTRSSDGHILLKNAAPVNVQAVGPSTVDVPERRVGLSLDSPLP